MKNKLWENNPDDGNWLLTYGDIMTLLLSFFVLLFALSSMDEFLYKDILLSLTESVGTSEKRPAADTEVLPKIKHIIELQGLANNVEILEDRNEVRIFGTDSVFFEAGSARIHPNAALFLKAIAKVIKQVYYSVRVEGHTDDLDAGRDKFASNWELSTARAVAVVRFFEKEGVMPDRLSAVGFAQYKPRYPPTPENRSRNRRVEIVLSNRSKKAKLFGGGFQSKIN